MWDGRISICRNWLGGLKKDLTSAYVFLVTSPELGGDLHLLDEAGDDHAQAGAAPALLVTEDAGHTGGHLLQDVCNVIRGQALCVECDPGAPLSLTCHHVKAELRRRPVLAHGNSPGLETLMARLPHVLIQILQTLDLLGLHLHLVKLPLKRVFMETLILETISNDLNL